MKINTDCFFSKKVCVSNVGISFVSSEYSSEEMVGIDISFLSSMRSSFRIEKVKIDPKLISDFK